VEDLDTEGEQLMGSSAEATLAYGYDLGTLEDFKAAQRSEYGSPDLPWFDEDAEDDEDTDFGSAVEKVLLAAAGFTEEWSPGKDGYFDRKKAAEEGIGVRLAHSGSHEYPGFILFATGSKRSVEWSDTMALDLDTLAETHDWDAKLSAALTALGITPTQDGPKWLVFPSYG
jgi:hypothetical protein